MSPLGVSRQLAINCTHSLIFHFCIDTEGEGTVLDKEKHEEIIPSSQPFFSLSLSLSLSVVFNTLCAVHELSRKYIIDFVHFSFFRSLIGLIRT